MNKIGIFLFIVLNKKLVVTLFYKKAFATCGEWS